MREHMMMFQEKKPRNLVQTIERVARILDIMSLSAQGISLKELSTKVDLPKGTTHRLLSSLAYFGYVRQSSDSKNYQLGFKLVELGSHILDQLDLRAQSKPYLVKLSQKTKETVHLVIMDQNEALYIDKVENSEKRGGLQMVSRVGLRVPVHCSSVGKVLLIGLSEGALEEIVKEKDLVKRTDSTITDLVKLKAHIKTVRAQGYAFDDEENEKGIRCVGAPIYGQRGQVIAAISISGPTIRITKQLLEKTLKNAVMKTALDISREFGYQE